MASNIRVVLEVDNKKYLAGVKQAESATTSFAKRAEQDLKQLRPAVDGVRDSFGKLSGIIAGIGIGAFVAQTVKTAETLVNLSRATGVALDTIQGLSNAFVAAGGSTDRAVDGINDLIKNIGDARRGSEELQRSFALAGVSISDLEKLSDRDILRKTITGLAEMPDRARATAIGMTIMGESIKGVDLRTLNRDLDGFISRAGAQSAAAESAAASQRNLATAFTQLQEKVLIAIKPITDFIASLTPQQIDQITTAIVDLGKALVAIAPALVALRSIAAIFGGLAATLLLSKTGMVNIASASKGAGVALGGLGKTAEIAYSYIDRFRRGTPMFGKDIPLLERVGTLFGKLGERVGYATVSTNKLGYSLGFAIGGFARMLPLIGQVIAGFVILNEVVTTLTGKSLKGWFDDLAAGAEQFVTNSFPRLAAALNTLGEKLGMAPPPSVVAENARELQRIQNRVKTLQEEAKAREQNNQANNQVKTSLAAFAREQQKIVEGYENANIAIIQRLGFERTLIGLSEDEVEVQRAREEVLNRQRSLIQGLIAEQEKLKVDLDVDKTGVTAGKIAAISATIASIQRETAGAQDGIENFTRRLQAAEAAERMRVGILQESNNLENIRAQLLGYSLTELEKFNQALGAEEFKNRTAAEIEQLKQQAIERDKLTQALTVERTVRETNSRLMDLESNIMGRQFTELEKLETLKTQNPEAFARKTEAETNALQQQARALDETAAKFQAVAFARDLMRQGEDFATGLRDQLNLDRAVGESARRRLQVEIEGRNQLNSKLREIQDRYGDERRLSEELRQQRAKEITDATAGIAKLQEAKSKAVAEDQAQRESFAFGWETAFGRYAEEAQNAANQATTYFTTFTRGFEDAIVRFVQTGKFSFKDLANSIIADFARIQAKKALSGLFGGGGGGGGFFGNIFGSIGSIFGFANGGNPAMGKPILVGERGPELMIPRNASTIIPNEALGGGSNQTTVTYNIQAVDAASFQQLVARDPKFLHAVVEKGRRAMPQGARQ